MREQLNGGSPTGRPLGGARAERLHHPHPCPGRPRCVSSVRVAECMGPVWEQIGVDRDTLLGLGQHPAMPGQFHMTATAMRLCLAGERCVPSARTGVTSSLARPLAGPPMGNGAHRARDQRRAPGNLDGQPDHGSAGRAPRVATGATAWTSRRSGTRCSRWITTSCGRPTCGLKGTLVNFMREDARRRFAGQLKEAAQVVGAGTLLDPTALTIGFAPPVRHL